MHCTLMHALCPNGLARLAEDSATSGRLHRLFTLPGAALPTLVRSPGIRIDIRTYNRQETHHAPTFSIRIRDRIRLRRRRGLGSGRQGSPDRRDLRPDRAVVVRPQAPRRRDGGRPARARPAPRQPGRHLGAEPARVDRHPVRDGADRLSPRQHQSSVPPRRTRARARRCRLPGSGHGARVQGQRLARHARRDRARDPPGRRQ